jgi:hypothetical protein
VLQQQQQLLLLLLVRVKKTPQCPLTLPSVATAAAAAQ